MSWKLAVDELGAVERDTTGDLHITGVLADFGLDWLAHLAASSGTVTIIGPSPAMAAAAAVDAADGSRWEQRAWEAALALFGSVEVVEASTFPEIENIPGRVY